MSEKAKLWLAVAILAVAAGFATYQLTRPGPVSDKIELVCVATGKVYRMSREEVTIIPMKNPDSGEYTLLPCHEQEGVRYVNSRYQSALEQLVDRNRWVDPETLTVRAP